jgi:hypothetical protein
MRHAGIGFPNGPASLVSVFDLPSPNLLMLVTEARFHHDEAIRAGKSVLSGRQVSVPSSPLGRHVRRVRSRRGEPQMSAPFVRNARHFVGAKIVIPATRRVIAGMADHHPVRDSAVRKQPRGVMCAHLLPGHPDLPVATVQDGSGPRPTRGLIIGSPDIGEGCGQRLHFDEIAALLRAALDIAARESGRLDRERDPAQRADARDWRMEHQLGIALPSPLNSSAATRGACRPDLGRKSKERRATNGTGTLYEHRATPRCRPRPLTRLRGLSATRIIPCRN